MKAILAYIRIWAQNKTEDRRAWLQALNVLSAAAKAAAPFSFWLFRRN